MEEVFTSLLNGAALAIPADEDKADIHALMAFVERHHVTMISGFPYLLAEMNHLSVIPSSLRLLISGGDVLRGVYVDHLLNKAEVYNTYGPSETTVCASYYRCNSGTVLEDGTYPIGHPVLGAQIRILDQSGNEVAKGQTGEICIYGGGVSLGYIGDHAEENRAFERQPDGSTMYRSGDLGLYPAGWQHCIPAPQGRPDHDLRQAGGTCRGGVPALSVQGCAAGYCPGFYRRGWTVLYDRLCGAFRQ